MADIGNVRPSNPIHWPPQPKTITPADKEKDRHSDQKNQQQKNNPDEQDDNNHLDEYV